MEKNTHRARITARDNIKFYENMTRSENVSWPSRPGRVVPGGCPLNPWTLMGLGQTSAAPFLGPLWGTVEVCPNPIKVQVFNGPLPRDLRFWAEIEKTRHGNFGFGLSVCCSLLSALLREYDYREGLLLKTLFSPNPVAIPSPIVDIFLMRTYIGRYRTVAWWELLFCVFGCSKRLLGEGLDTKNDKKYILYTFRKFLY